MFPTNGINLKKLRAKLHWWWNQKHMKELKFRQSSQLFVLNANLHWCLTITQRIHQPHKQTIKFHVPHKSLHFVIHLNFTYLKRRCNAWQCTGKLPHNFFLCFCILHNCILQLSKVIKININNNDLDQNLEHTSGPPHIYMWTNTPQLLA